MAGIDQDLPVRAPTSRLQSYDPSTQAVHADDIHSSSADVAPAMHVSTTFTYSKNPDELIPFWERDLHATPDTHIYSRMSAPNTTRLETVLSSLMHGHTVTYSSGLSALHAMFIHFNPKVVAIAKGKGYHGTHGVLAIHQRLSGVKIVDLFDEAAWDESGLGKGDVVHVESPLNPTGEAFNLLYYAEKAHARGAYLTVDATFGPPGLQDPFVQGADMIMHSGTKYVGGHTDLLCGILAVQREDWWKGLSSDRMILGSVMGSFEGWLGLRSVRTMELRVQRESESATKLVQWLDEGLKGQGEDSEAIKKVVARVQHASLQKDDMDWLKKQMPNGYGPVFSFSTKSMDMARTLPSKLRLFHHATSLGGVESLIEWRRMSDRNIDDCLMRVSIGIEHWEDLKRDLLQAFASLTN